MKKKKKPKIFLSIRWCFSIGPLSSIEWSFRKKIKRENPMPEKRGDRKKKLLNFVVTKIQTLALTH